MLLSQRSLHNPLIQYVYLEAGRITYILPSQSEVVKRTQTTQDYRIGTARKMSANTDAIPDSLLLIQQSCASCSTVPILVFPPNHIPES